MASLRLTAMAALLLAPLACGGEDSPPRADRAAAAPSGAAPRHALCERLESRVTGRVSSAAAGELSGLVLSRSQPGVLWTHNDSGDRARIFAITPRGTVKAAVAVNGATNVDWEDIATGPLRGPGDALYIGDIGDNLAERPEVAVYRVREPRLADAPPSTTRPAERLALRYPDGAHDAEALLVDPSSGALVLVTKDFEGRAGVYVAARPSARSVTVMRRVTRIPLGAAEPVTAGDLSADGQTIVLRSYGRAYVWTRRRGKTLASALRGPRCRARVELFAERQGEALAVSRNGRAFYTVPEGRRPALRRYGPAR